MYRSFVNSQIEEATPCRCEAATQGTGDESGDAGAEDPAV